LRATTKGILLIDLLRRTNIDRLASARLTGEMEMHLQEVEQGKRKRQEFMEEIFTYARDIVERGKTSNSTLPIRPWACAQPAKLSKCSSSHASTRALATAEKTSAATSSSGKSAADVTSTA
jgi:hypothetical protein